MASEDGKIRKVDLVEKGAESGYTDLEKRAKEALKGIAKALDDLSKAEKRAGITKNELTKLEKERIAEIKKAEAASIKLTKATESARKARLKEADAIDKNKKALDKQRVSSKKATDATKSQEKASKGLTATFKNLLRSMVAFIGVRMFIQTVKDTFELVKTLDSLRFAMSAIIKDTIELGQTQDWLKKITNDYGAELVNTTERYIKFRAAAIQSNLSAKDTQEIFGTMTKAAGVLGLKTDELRGIYLALEQMLSKGKVTTEELRRQLGERLPGAMGIMADALGVTIPKLDEMLKKGEVLSAETLPKFAKQVEIAFGLESIKRVDTLAAATSRLKNSWTILVSEFTNGNKISKKLSAAINFMAENLGDLISFAYKSIKAFVIYKSLMLGYSAVLQVLKARTAALIAIETIRTKGLKLAVIEMWKLNVATAANPIGALVAVLIAAVAILYSFVSGIDFAADSQELLTAAIEKTTKAQEKLNNTILSNREAQLKAIDDYYDRLIAGSINENKIDELKKTQSATKLVILKAELESVKTNIEAYNNSLKSFTKGTAAYETRNTVIKIQSKRYLELLDLINKLENADLGLSDATKGTVAWYRKQITATKALIELEKDRGKIIPIQKEVNKLQKELNALLGIEKKGRGGLNKDKVNTSGFDLAIIELEEKMRIEKEISDNKDREMDDRLTASKNFYKWDLELLKLNYDKQIALAEGNADKIILINQKYKFAKTGSKEDEVSDKESKALEFKNKELITLEDEKNTELIRLRTEYKDNAEKLKEEEEKLNLDINKRIIQSEIDYAKKKILIWEDLGLPIGELKSKILQLEAALAGLGDTDGIDKQKESFQEILEAASQFNDALGGLFDAISARKIENIDAEIVAEEAKYDKLLQLASDDAAQTESIQREKDAALVKLEKKRLKEVQKAAKQKKANALIDIAINTAVAISNAPKESLIFGLAAVPVLVALGALQAAAVLAQPIPQFAEGGDMMHDGKALINDGGNREYVERNGVILSSPIKNAVVDLQKGDTIHKDYNSLMNASIMTSLANDNKNLDSSRLKLIFDDNYANLENVIGKSLSKAKFNNNISLNGFDKNQELYRQEQSRWS